jgi:hypothetical protein
MDLREHPLLREFVGPARRSQFLSGTVEIPNAPGVYLWCFRQPLPGVPLKDCLTHEDWPMLYVGISPDKRSNPNSRQGLRARLRYHLSGNAEGSTLRRTLGILLSEQSGFPLRRVGSGKRMTLTHLGEQSLDSWLNDNALIFWRTLDEPWYLEDEIMQSVSCPLNLRGNEHHPFIATLRAARAAAISVARSTPIAAEGNQSRRIQLIERPDN